MTATTALQSALWIPGVIAMRAEAGLVGAEVGELLQPAYWFVSGLDWPGDRELAEAAIALAPGVVPRKCLSHDGYQVLGCADLYAAKHRERVVFFSDLTGMFAENGTSWSELGVDWETALAELSDGLFPAMFLTISQQAHLCICKPASAMRARLASGMDERELIRQVIGGQLSADWPSYMQTLIDAGRVRGAAPDRTS